MPKFFLYLLPIFLLFTCLPAYAGPASPDMITLTQPDGKKIKAFIRGDEFQGWTETADGFTVIENRKDGWWEYATDDGAGGIKSSGKRVDTAPPAGLKRHLRPKRDEGRERSFRDLLKKKRGDLAAASASSSATGGGVSGQAAEAPSAGAWDPVPVSGARNLLIILVEFAGDGILPDITRNLSTTIDGWNSTTFSTAAGAKSVANFYKDNSFGALTVTGVPHTQAGNPPGLIIVRINKDHPDCGNNFNYTIETTWINAALAQAASYVNFPALDTNHDGVFEDSELVVYFILAGYEASCTSKHPNIWAHAWGGNGVSAGGIALTSWALNGELNDSDAQQPMGAIAHELGHSMGGLPDLYDTSYTNQGLGAFSVMSYGSWGKASADAYSGMTPVSFDAWSRQYMGWSAPRSLVGGTMSFGPALSSASAPVKLKNTAISTSQYFLIENRYSTGWDKGMEQWLGTGWGGGLLIMHIDESIGSPSNNDINKYVAGSHQGVMAEEASTVNGSLVGNTSTGNVTHLFWNGNNANFSDASSPNSKLYDGTATNFSVINISSRSQTMTASVQGLPPVSSITGPAGGSILQGRAVTITGTATDNSGTGIKKVDVSTDGGSTWNTATGTASWSYGWTLPATGSYNIRSRATDNNGQMETPGVGINVTVNNSGLSELQHYNWDAGIKNQGCAVCHFASGSFVGQDYRQSEGFCRSCHNAGGMGHDSPGRGGHPVLVNASSATTKKPTYGSVTSAENDNRPYAHLKDGKLVICVTCHNTMNKYEDFGRTWEYTTRLDDTTFSLQRGGWDFMGRMTPRVYRDSALWSEGGPTYSKDKKVYLVDPSEYVFNEYSGIIKFNSSQPSSYYIYASLDYPYLRASSQGNRLCADCHSEATHEGANCLACHQAHETANIEGIRPIIRTPDMLEFPVKFVGFTGMNSFADGDAIYDGICEVCHTRTKYYRRDGSGFVNHSGGFNYNRKDCTACHSQSSGFAK